MTKIHTGLIHLIVAVTVIPATWVALWLWLPVTPPIYWENDNTFIPTKARAGEEIYISRHHHVLHPFKADIIRQMVKENGGVTATLFLDPVAHYFEAGEHNYMRPFKVPCALTPGKWKLITTLSWVDQLNRVQAVRSPVLELEVTAPCAPVEEIKYVQPI